MKRKTIIYGTVDGVGPVGGGLPPKGSDANSEELKAQSKRVADVANIPQLPKSTRSLENRVSHEKFKDTPAEGKYGLGHDLRKAAEESRLDASEGDPNQK